MHPFRTALLFLFVLGTRGLFADGNSTKISAAEYFVDTDPGEGSGTALSAQDGAFDSEVESIAPVDLNVTGLAVGPHLIGIRYKDDNNTWGEVLYQTIHVYDANPDSNASGGGGNGGGSGSSGGFATIKGAEYFVGTDPGEGNGTAFQAQDGAFDSEVESILPKDLNVTGLSVGPHLVGVRYQDNNNTWGEVLYQTIHVYDANPDSNASGGGGNGGGGGSSGGFATIKGAEYFVDTDPGEGNGTAFQAKDGAFDSEVESILPKDLNVTGLSVGPHLVGVRYQDNNNTWGEVLYQTIHVYDANPDSNASGGGGNGGGGGSSGGFATIKGAEYFVDTDPGEGNGTAFQAQDGAFDSEVESILPKDLNVTGLAVGPHLVGVRYQDNNNTWGEVLYQTIHVYDANPDSNASGGGGNSGGGGSFGGFATIKGAEYFVDTDPGEGNGTAFQAKDGAFDSEVEAVLPKDLNVTGLAVGPHLVGVRYQDNNNTWGEVLYQTIHVYDANPDTNASGSGGSGGSGGTGGFTVIAGAEYFIGNDPGEGNATALQPKDGAFDSEVESTLTASLSLEGYAIGAYLVGVRYMDNNGTWGDVLYKTIEVDVDTDGDGLADKAEIYYETNSTVQDTDGDGYLDGEEVAFGSDPTDVNSTGNRAPTDLNATTVLNILENQPVGTFITEFNATDTDANNTLTYSLADGNGSGGNPFFTLDPNGTLVSAVIFDYENNASSYSIRVRVSDQHGYKMEGNFSISLLDLNEAPTDLNTTAPLQVLENQPVGSVVGQLTAHDPDAGTIQNFSLVVGSDDNHFFSVDTNGTLRTASALDYEANATLTIQAKVRDQHNLWIKQNFIVQILNVVEDLDGDGTEDHFDTDDDGDGYSDAEEIAYGSDPRDVNSTANAAPQITLANAFPNQLDANGVLHIGHTENKTHIIKVSATDADGDDLNYSIYGWQDLPNFEINASSGDLSFKYIPDFESANDHNNDGIFRIILRVSDHKEHHDQPVWIWLVNENEPPFDLNSTAPLAVAENQPVGTVVGQLTAQDPDANSTLAFTLVGGSNDNHVFSIDTNGTLKTTAQLDYESNSYYVIRAQVRDQNNSSIKRNFTVNVLNVIEDLDQDGIEDAFDTDIDGDGYSNEIELAYPSDPRDPNSVADTLPTNLTLSNLEIMENQPVGTVVGQFSVSDPDPNDVSRVRLNENNVSDHQLFTIDANNTLRTAVMFDYENNASSFVVHAKVKQSQVGVFWKSFSLSLLDDPSDNLPSTDNNQTTTPVIDHNTTHDQNTTQPPVIDGNETYDQNATQPVIDGNDTIVENNQTTIEPVTPKYIPIVRTKEVTRNEQGAYVFRGRILSDGGASIIKAGFEISESLGFQESRRLFAQLNGDSFQVKVDDLNPGTNYFYRAFARNEMGKSSGSSKRLEMPVIPQSNAWWHALPEQNGRWRTSPWFGSFLPYSNGWLFHADLGWLYSHSGPTADLWLWSAEHGWLWTADGVYPYFFQNSSAHWLYFIMKKDGVARFYDYTTQSVISPPPSKPPPGDGGDSNPSPPPKAGGSSAGSVPPPPSTIQTPTTNTSNNGVGRSPPPPRSSTFQPKEFVTQSVKLEKIEATATYVPPKDIGDVGGELQDNTRDGKSLEQAREENKFDTQKFDPTKLNIPAGISDEDLKKVNDLTNDQFSNEVINATTIHYPNQHNDSNTVGGKSLEQAREENKFDTQNFDPTKLNIPAGISDEDLQQVKDLTYGQSTNKAINATTIDYSHQHNDSNVMTPQTVNTNLSGRPNVGSKVDLGSDEASNQN